VISFVLVDRYHCFCETYCHYLPETLVFICVSIYTNDLIALLEAELEITGNLKLFSSGIKCYGEYGGRWQY